MVIWLLTKFVHRSHPQAYQFREGERTPYEQAWKKKQEEIRQAGEDRIQEINERYGFGANGEDLEDRSWMMRAMVDTNRRRELEAAYKLTEEEMRRSALVPWPESELRAVGMIKEFHPVLNKEQMDRLNDFGRRHPHPFREYDESIRQQIRGTMEDETKTGESMFNESEAFKIKEPAPSGLKYFQPGVADKLQTTGNDHDVYHITKDQRTQEFPSGDADSPSTAYSSAVWQNQIDRTDHDVVISCQGAFYRWRLVPRQKEVEPAREQVKAEKDQTIECIDYINLLITNWKKSGAIKNAKGISDGYHTFEQLYDMRLALTKSVFRLLYEASWRNYQTGKSKDLIPFNNPVWRSRQHSDGTMFEGMFIVGMYNQPGHMITFHYHDEHWDKFNFCETLNGAPVWDGHTDKEVIERLLHL